MTNLVIRNAEPRLVELPSLRPKVDKQNKVTAPGFNAFRLLPGENDVPSEYWDRVKANPGVKILLASGTIENKGAGKATPILASLDNIPTDSALRHIGRCENVKVLNEWKAGTTSPGLRKAIEERVLELVAAQNGDAPAPRTAVSDDDETPVDPFVEATIQD